MAPSFQKINYALRPAKHTERRMLCDVFRQASNFDRLSNYTYVGFGGIEFSDFIMFHRSLGIKNMISMERADHALPRVESNKPFNTITIVGEPSSKALPKFAWDRPHIIWLDYDDPLKLEMLLDVSTITSKAKSGSILTFSFQCFEAREITLAKPKSQDAVSHFISTFGRDRVSLETDELDLRGTKFGDLGRKMMLNEIQSQLAIRNLGSDQHETLEYREICSIRYSDNAPMFTVCGIFVSKEDENKFVKCEFESLNFLPAKGNHIEIEVPKLTLREIKALEKQLPLHNGKTIDCGAIPKKDASQFERLYRYLPNFAVLEN